MMLGFIIALLAIAAVFLAWMWVRTWSEKTPATIERRINVSIDTLPLDASDRFTPEYTDTQLESIFNNRHHKVTCGYCLKQTWPGECDHCGSPVAIRR